MLGLLFATPPSTKQKTLLEVFVEDREGNVYPTSLGGKKVGAADVALL